MSRAASTNAQLETFGSEMLESPVLEAFIAETVTGV